MSETTHNQELSEDNYSPTVTAELLSGTELDLDREHARQKRWLETGDCEGPTIVGTITVDEISLAHLMQNIGNEYLMAQGAAMYSVDDNIAAIEAQAEEIEPLDPHSRLILSKIRENFGELIDADIARSALTEKVHFEKLNLSFGNVEFERPEAHCDDLETEAIRYIVVILGSGTVFYTGNFRRSYFDKAGDLETEVSVPDSAIPVTQPLLTVLRFVNNTDPHTTPTTNGSELRIVADATVLLND